MVEGNELRKELHCDPLGFRLFWDSIKNRPQRQIKTRSPGGRDGRRFRRRGGLSNWPKALPDPILVCCSPNREQMLSKIEPPQGDKARGTPGFHVWNRSTRSVIADPATAEGKDFILSLASTADIVLTDYQPEEVEKLGLNYEVFSQDNPGLIYCHLPAYGGYGPHAGRYPDDTLVAAVSGLLGSQWSHRDGGVYLVLPIASYGAAFVASSSISAALFEREGSGRGQKIEVSWLAGAFAMQSGTILYHPELLRLFSGRLNPLGPIPVYRLYKAKDDWLFVACGNTTFWNKFCLALEHPEWTSDPRYEKAPWGNCPRGPG